METDTKRILILGGDGYLGWPCVLYFLARGHKVHIVDSLVRRCYDIELGLDPLWPVPPWHTRVSHVGPECHCLDLATDVDLFRDLIRALRPDVIIHSAEQRSAPYSMIDYKHALYTQRNNVLGTLNVLYAMRDLCPDAHLIKLGTMGEYGTPDIDIEEGFIEVHHKGRSDVLPFPKQAGSWYHQTKVHDSNNIMFACKLWGLKATDLNQGVVYGAETDECPADSPLCTRFDYDAVFGTCLNRFCVQAACGIPLTVYGHGGQTRGYIDIRDTMRCIELAIDNPPGSSSLDTPAPSSLRDLSALGGASSPSSTPHSALRTPHSPSPIPSFQVFNQITELFSVNELARLVQLAGDAMELDPPVRIEHLPNPRVEAEKHHYQPSMDKFKVLGLHARKLTDAIPRLIELALQHKDRIRTDTILPEVTWR